MSSSFESPLFADTGDIDDAYNAQNSTSIDISSTALGSDSLRPLAVRMRPRSLDEVIGQKDALKVGSPLQQLALPSSTQTSSAPSAVILFGPPGVGKTTIASIVARQSHRFFEQLSAISSGVKDIRDVINRARDRLIKQRTETVLFIDEVHRFSKSQQDALLAAVENRDITFIAATTENPSFSIISPLLSRSVVVKLTPLDSEDIAAILQRALADPRGLDKKFNLDSQAQESIIRLSAGDGRKALTLLESAAGAALQKESPSSKAKTIPITNHIVSQVAPQALVHYDRDGDEHYDVASAFIKSMRGSDPDASLHYLARMLEGGEDPRFIARRIMISAAEDVGMAAPQILQTAVAAAQAVDMVGMPEARIILAQAVIAVATAPKSNASYNAINAALSDVHAGNIGEVPLHLRNAVSNLSRSWGHHDGYRYAHDFPAGIAPQEYMPHPLRGKRYYYPTERGYELEITHRLDTIQKILHQSSRPDKNSTDSTHKRSDSPSHSSNNSE